MYRIGEFSVLAKTTVKTLRHYEKEGLLSPTFVDEETGYRFYEARQLLEFAKIIALRQIGISIPDIKEILYSDKEEEILGRRKREIEAEISVRQDQLSRILYLLEERNMKQEIIVKELPEYIVYMKKGTIPNYSHITDFILSSGEECHSTNPNIQCVEPNYCYISYLDGEYKEKDISLLYAQAVTTMGVPNKTITFEKLKPVTAACIYHKGAYDQLGESYGSIMKWIEENNYQIIEPPRERYIDGIWNKENVEEWLTEIQVPIVKKV